MDNLTRALFRDARRLIVKITVFDERKQSTRNVTFKGKNVQDLLLQLKLNSEIVLVVRDKEVITPEEILHNKDRLEILSVISGG